MEVGQKKKNRVYFLFFGRVLPFRFPLLLVVSLFGLYFVDLWWSFFAFLLLFFVGMLPVLLGERGGGGEHHDTAKQ